VSPLQLIRATPDNGLFDELMAAWTPQLRQDDAPVEYYTPMLDHARKISGEHPQDPRYGIFVLVEPNGAGTPAAFEGIVHVNHAWPKLPDATLRLVWNLIAPHYQYEEVVPERIARIMSGFLTEALKLCGNDMPARHVKMYLGNAVDREYAKVAVGFMELSYPGFSFAVRGNWLHISNA